MATDYDQVFKDLIDIIHEQREIIHEMAEYLVQIKSIGGGGGTGNGFQIYEANHLYKRYQALIDPNTDTAYLVVPAGGLDEYTSVSVKTDCQNGNLKLLGYESQIVTFDHAPQREEVEVLPENVVVVEYNPSDTPYTGIVTNDEHEEP